VRAAFLRGLCKQRLTKTYQQRTTRDSLHSSNTLHGFRVRGNGQLLTSKTDIHTPAGEWA
ncbi:MAG: hypothetical protein KDA37_07855, partial [Planctomycetales bacterium]|nr:hypothetical protein [Planctomycetales bacterium]